MNQDSSQTTPAHPSLPPPAAPPTTPGPVRVRRPASWPVTLGVWGVVLGVVWTLFALLGGVLLAVGIVRDVMSGGFPSLLTDPWPLVGLLKCGIDAAIGVGTVDAGQALAGRRRRGARLLVRWSWGRLAVLAVSMAGAAWIPQGQVLLELPWRALGGSGIGAAAVFGAPFPVLALWWLGRARVRAELSNLR